MLTSTKQLQHIMAVRPRDLVIVVGAGVSIGALKGSPLVGLASWRGLLHHGLDQVEGQGGPARQDVGRIRGLLDSQDPGLWIDAAEWLTRMLGGRTGGAFRTWLRATAGAFAGEPRQADVLAALAAMAEQGAVLATTNYDGLLEAVTGAPAVTWRAPAKVERVIRGDDRGILHLHGYWDDPASVVLGTRSYDEVVGDEHARAALQALRMTRTFLFVGHGAGLGDPNWGSFLRWTEQVFAGSEYVHYRLVREEERETTQAEHPQEQRIVALSYGRVHAELAPFLRSLLPAPRVVAEVVDAVAAGSSAQSPRGAGELAAKTIVLVVNIGEPHYDFLTREQASEQVGDPEAVWLDDVTEVVPQREISPRLWRDLVKRLDAMVDAAKRETTGRARYIVMGQAPLPVFVYLGQRMIRLGPITVINRRPGEGGTWDHVGPLAAIPAGGRDDFTPKTPSLGRESRGKVVLSIQCSLRQKYHESMVEPMIAAEGAELLCSYQVHNETHVHLDVPMTAAELPALLRHVDDAIQWFGEKCRDAEGLVLCLAGPSWVGFWIGHRLNPNAYGGRIDVPDRVGPRYQRALALPMHRAPWLAGEAKLLVVAAEPEDQARTRASKLADTIRGFNGSAADQRRRANHRRRGLPGR